MSYNLGWEASPHPSNSPDLVPIEYQRFIALSNSMQRQKLDDEGYVKQWVITFSESNPKTFYVHDICFLRIKWQKARDRDRKYFVA